MTSEKQDAVYPVGDEGAHQIDRDDERKKREVEESDHEEEQSVGSSEREVELVSLHEQVRFLLSQL